MTDKKRSLHFCKDHGAYEATGADAPCPTCNKINPPTVSRPFTDRTDHQQSVGAICLQIVNTVQNCATKGSETADIIIAMVMALGSFAAFQLKSTSNPNDAIDNVCEGLKVEFHRALVGARAAQQAVDRGISPTDYQKIAEIMEDAGTKQKTSTTPDLASYVPSNGRVH